MTPWERYDKEINEVNRITAHADRRRDDAYDTLLAEQKNCAHTRSIPTLNGKAYCVSCRALTN